MGRKPRNCQLYVKGQSESKMPEAFFRDIQIITDRNISTVRELARIYGDAHAFIMPSAGEGWGLCLCEAQATGLPCIWTAWSAMLDYADETTGYPITQFSMAPFWPTGRENIGNPCLGAVASEAAIIERMEEIYGAYPEALARGKAASERMHSRYTWAQSAEKFNQICERAMEFPVLPSAAARLAQP